MVATPFVRLVLDAGEGPMERGVQGLIDLLSRWGLSVAELENDPTLRLPVPLMNEMCRLCIDVLDDPAAPLRAAMLLEEHDDELLEYLCTSAPTMRDSIRCMGQYYRLLADAEYELREEGDRAEVVFSFASGVEADPSLYEFALASNLAMAMLHLDWDNVHFPIESRYRHSAPAHADLFESIMLSPVRFDCDDYATVFPSALLDLPMKPADPILHAVLRRQADRELAALPALHALTHRVREVLERDLSGDTSLEAAAHALAMSPSNLRAKLREHGTTFSDVLDELRRDHARRLLADRTRSIAEIANALGFAHPPALHRATQRWFGCSPSNYRAALRRPAVAQMLRPS